MKRSANYRRNAASRCGYCYENSICLSVRLSETLGTRDLAKTVYVTIAKFGFVVSLVPSNICVINDFTSYFRSPTNGLDIDVSKCDCAINAQPISEMLSIL